MVVGKTIQIYLPDGNPRSIRIAEITSRTVQAVLVPRAKIEEAGSRQELESVGVYLLIGNPDEETKPLVYVGEAEDCYHRLKQHDKGKDFWNLAIAVVSKTGYFTKSHGRYLEWLCIEEALRAGRYRVENAFAPSKPYVPEPVQADLHDNFETIKTLVSTLGHPVFDAIARPERGRLLVCKGEGVQAEGEYREDGFVVFAQSTFKVNETPTIGKWTSTLRANLDEEGILALDGKVYRLTQDQLFSSPSAAASAVLGRSANGWTLWKYSDGRTMDQVRQEAASS